MSKKSRLTHQYLQNLQKQTKYNESKHEAKKAEKEASMRENRKYEQVHGIYSTATYKSYSDACAVFVQYCLDNHKSDIRNFSDCRQYVEEFLQHLEDSKQSAWTIHHRASALGAAYGCSKKDFDYKCPERHRADIKRTRGIASSDYRYPEERWDEMKLVIKATGCRRMELLRLRPEDIRQREDGNWEVFKRGKNKLERWCMITPKYSEQVIDILRSHETYRIAGEYRYFQKSEIPKGAIHDLRADYAKDLYEYYQSQGIDDGRKYRCRNDMAGKEFSKSVLEKVSHDMLHSRCDVIVNNYMWKSR